MSLLALEPERARAQIVLNAQHQFAEGDVLHWWHPPLSQGMRTRFADDLLWLPFLTAHYLHTTGDRSVLDESAGSSPRASWPRRGRGVLGPARLRRDRERL
jgi:cyclic beta-1,2-glucan synthetase